MSNAKSRSAFTPLPCSLASTETDPYPSLSIVSTSQTFQPIICCPSSYDLPIFAQSFSQLIEHPEYNSTLILRSETLRDSDHDSEFHEETPKLDGHFAIRQIVRRLVARRPGRDSSMEQLCTLYADESSAEDACCVVVLTPLREKDQPLPYYHPDVSHLAFRYLVSTKTLRIEVVPSPSTDAENTASSTSAAQPKIYRTCMHLLSTIHRFSPSYQKTFFHDRLIPRDVYQDVYLLMRERHGARCVNNWQEVTDPRKHVYEDISIATYLILLWFYTFATAPDLSQISSLPKPTDPETNRRDLFKSWPRPPGGFLDLGCGNGLLTHILIWEGYTGMGVDVRARHSWEHYDETTRNSLRVVAVDPTLCNDDSASNSTNDEKFIVGNPGCFIIGNHADELTPWIPVLSRVWNACGYLSIPCCPWAWDSRWGRGYADPKFEDDLDRGDIDPEESPMTEEMLKKLGLDDGLGGPGSTYAQYRAWVAQVSEKCGWMTEYDVLRIPSTRNWALIGRTIVPKIGSDGDGGLRFARAVVGTIRNRGIFQARRPEGNAGAGH